ncbi:hypothetical protein BY996DRAFT_4352998 [Phakopsora pachyrhizi]|nr:hypothetical protein BY996DRAFT_4352998 [Phakopsora pachyrhizi]
MEMVDSELKDDSQMRVKLSDEEEIKSMERTIEDQSSLGLNSGRANQVIKTHIEALDKYNACKDQAVQILKTIANVEGKTLKQVYQQFDISAFEE